MILGTADYIAPEQVGEARNADHRADMYSLGCTLYFLLSGQPPFPHLSTLEKLLAHQQQEPERLERLRRDLPAGLAEVVARMMARDPTQRYQSMTEVIAVLRPFTNATLVRLETGDDTAMIRRQVLAEMRSEEPSRTTLLPRPPRSRRFLWAALLLFAVVAAAGVVFKLQGKNGSIVVEVMEPDVEVLVDGGKITVGSKKAGPIVLEAGEHEVIVKRGDETLFTRTFRLEKGGQKIIEASWKPKLADPFAATSAGVFDKLDPAKIPEKERFDWQPKELVAVLGEYKEEGKSTGVFSHVALSPDGKRLLTASAAPNQPVQLWDVLTGKELRRWTLPANAGASGVAYSPAGDSILVTGSHIHARVWDVETGKERIKFDPEQQAAQQVIFGGVYLPDGGRVVMIHRDRHAGPCTPRLWDTKMGKELKAFVGHSRYVYAVACSPDGRLLLSGGLDQSLRLWNVETAKQLWLFEEKGKEAAIGCLAFSLKGNLAASGGSSGAPPRLWEVTGQDLKERFVLSGPAADRTMAALAFSPDGRILAGGTDDGRLFLWDCATGKKLREWQWRGAISSLAWAPDGWHIATANSNGTGYILRLSPPR